jgi:hypothetical protein
MHRLVRVESDRCHNFRLTTLSIEPFAKRSPLGAGGKSILALHASHSQALLRCFYSAMWFVSLSIYDFVLRNEGRVLDHQRELAYFS